MKRPMNLHVKKALLSIGGFAVSVAPLAVVVGMKWGEYTHTVTRSVSLGIGGVLAIVLSLLKALGKLPEKTKPVVKYGVAFGLVCLLDPLIADLKLLLGAAFMGEAMDFLMFSWQVNRVNMQISGQYTAQGMAQVTQQQTAQTDKQQPVTPVVADEAEGRA